METREPFLNVKTTETKISINNRKMGTISRFEGNRNKRFEEGTNSGGKPTHFVVVTASSSQLAVLRPPFPCSLVDPNLSRHSSTSCEIIDPTVSRPCLLPPPPPPPLSPTPDRCKVESRIGNWFLGYTFF